MTLVEFLLFLLVAAVIGGIGKAIAGLDRGGFLLALVVGFVGAWAGGWFAVSLGLPELFVVQIDEARFYVVWSIVGAALFATLASLLFGVTVVEPPPGTAPGEGRVVRRRIIRRRVVRR